MENGILLESIDIRLDSSVHSVTKVAAMCLSGSIANGIVIAQNPNPVITIFKNKIEFGKCLNPDLMGINGAIATNFFIEFGKLVYYYDSAYKISFWNKTLDYKGMFAPSVPDDVKIFNMIYPKFA